MSKKLEGKVAVVTGASKGIGASIAKALAEEGASQPGDDRNRGIACGGVRGNRLPESGRGAGAARALRPRQTSVHGDGGRAGAP